MGGITDFVHRHARTVLTVGVVIAAVSIAGTIGWITAPI